MSLHKAIQNQSLVVQLGRETISMQASRDSKHCDVISFPIFDVHCIYKTDDAYAFDYCPSYAEDP